jgi:hypothetical protein
MFQPFLGLSIAFPPIAEQEKLRVSGTIDTRISQLRRVSTNSCKTHVFWRNAETLFSTNLV